METITISVVNLACTFEAKEHDFCKIEIVFVESEVIQKWHALVSTIKEGFLVHGLDVQTEVRGGDANEVPRHGFF